MTKICDINPVNPVNPPATGNADANIRLIGLICSLFLAMSLTAAAQDTAAVAQGTASVSMFMIDAGYASVHDSYLTPITYDGLDLGMVYEAMRPARFAPQRWLWQLQVGVDYNYVENPAANNNLHKLMAEVAFDMQRQWRGAVARRLDLSVGPLAVLRAGAVYNPVNSNNTVTARAHVGVGVTGMAAWRTRLWRLPVTLRYQAMLPVVGVFFAPEYDESYYEIYLGNHRNLAHMGWWGNRLDMTHYLGADLHLGKTTLRLGYRTRLEHWTVSHIKVHDVTHSLVLGIGTSFFQQH